MQWRPCAPTLVCIRIKEASKSCGGYRDLAFIQYGVCWPLPQGAVGNGGVLTVAGPVGQPPMYSESIVYYSDYPTCNMAVQTGASSAANAECAIDAGNATQSQYFTASSMPPVLTNDQLAFG
jgi:hypothetical protein